MKDPVVEEVRKVREAYAAQLGYDPERIFQDLKEREAQERRRGRRIVRFRPRPARVRPNQPAEPVQGAKNIKA